MPAIASGVSFKPGGHAFGVVGQHDGAHDGREVQDVARRGAQLLVGHRPVGGAEVDGLLGDLLDAAAAADRLVVEAHGRVDLEYSLNHFE